MYASHVRNATPCRDTGSLSPTTPRSASMPATVLVNALLMLPMANSVSAVMGAPLLVVP